jgi:hypothetical protein
MRSADLQALYGMAVKSWNKFGTFLFLLIAGVLFCAPLQRVVEVSVANRNGALERGQNGHFWSPW